MVLESNRELVLRRLLECLARDRTKHQVAEVTSLGLVQMTRKRVGSGLLEAFSEPCECCNGRGVIVSLDLVDRPSAGRGRGDGRAAKEGRQSKAGKNGKESGRRTPKPAAARADGDESNGADAAAGEAGTDEAGTGGLEPDGEAVADGAAADAAAADGAGADGAGADGAGVDDAGTARPPGGRRRRRAATREQGPPEPVGQTPEGQTPEGQTPGSQMSADPAPSVAGSTAYVPDGEATGTPVLGGPPAEPAAD
jgi:ribonuclease E